MARKKEALVPEEEENKVVEVEELFEAAAESAVKVDDVAGETVSAEEVAEMVAADQAALEEVQTETRPRGRTPKKQAPADEDPQQQEKKEPQPALTAAPRRSARLQELNQKNYEAEREQRQKDAITVGRYIAANKRETIMSGRIAGVEIRDGHAFWLVMDGPVTVFIPFREAMPFLPENILANIKPRSRARREAQMLTKAIGATIDFTVEELVPDGESYLAFGSRKAALKKISRRYFGKGASDPVQVGDDIIGHVLVVGPNAAWVTVHGEDVRVNRDSMSHRYIFDMQEHYAPGDEVRLRLQRIEHVDGKMQLVLSGRPCEVDAGKRLHSRIHRGSRFVATATTHRILTSTNPRTGREERYYIANMWIEDLNIPAFANLANPEEQKAILTGDKMVVEIDQFARSGYVRCKIIKRV